MEAIVEASGLCKIYPRGNINRVKTLLGSAIILTNGLVDSKNKDDLLHYLRVALDFINSGEEAGIRIDAVEQLGYAANKTNKIAVTK